MGRRAAASGFDQRHGTDAEPREDLEGEGKAEGERLLHERYLGQNACVELAVAKGTRCITRLLILCMHTTQGVHKTRITCTTLEVVVCVGA